MKIVGWILVSLLLFILLPAGYMQFVRPYTPAIKNAQGRSIASLEKVPLGGLEQWILIRGRDRGNPVVLFLHGGPGMPAMYLAHRFQRPLENDFTMVHWDQRGAGKSYHADIPPQAMRMANLVADAGQLATMLKKRFRQEKIFLIGHSFGSYLGMLVVSQHPELFHAFIGVGQVAEHEKSRELQERFIRREALARNDLRLLEELNTKGNAVRETLLFRYGGELHRRTSMWPLLIAGFLAPEYSLGNILKIADGVGFTHRHLDYSNQDQPLLDRVTSVAVPVYFFIGRHDYVTPAAMAEVYFKKLQAPQKKLVWFEESAHFPFFEEPEKFAREMKTMALETTGAVVP